MIDLHTHTTASDGRAAPAELVAHALDAGVRVLGVTDHDTTAGCAEARAACAAAGLEFVDGIEITAVREEVDVHVLGYFIDPEAAGLRAFLADQRQQRVDRVRRMIARLAQLGLALDADEILRPALERAGASVGRPAIARALVTAGHVSTTDDAFSLWLARGRPAFVARQAASPDAVIQHIHDAGGVASLAHPGLLARDEWIDGIVGAGLDAIEVFHTRHDAAAVERYRAIAVRCGLLVTGGSDYHGDDSHGAPHPGAASLPADEYARLVAARTSPRRLVAQAFRPARRLRRQP